MTARVEYSPVSRWRADVRRALAALDADDYWALTQERDQAARMAARSIVDGDVEMARSYASDYAFAELLIGVLFERRDRRDIMRAEIVPGARDETGTPEPHASATR